MTPRRAILIGIALGLSVGAVTGFLGAMFDWPMVVRGAVMGAGLVLGFWLLGRKARTPGGGA
jgi:hypothetical protein